jgi:hypothetical protein
VVEIDPEKLKNVIDGMQGIVDDPLDIAVFVVLLAGVFTAILIVHRHQVRRDLERKLDHAQSRFNRCIRECNLNQTDMTILENMVKLLNDPTRVHQLVENQAIFNTYASELAHCTVFMEADIAALRLKLGFKPREPQQVFHSTAELNTDMPVLIVQKNKIVSHGRILDMKPRGMEIALAHRNLNHRRGVPIQIYFQTPTGLYGFPSSIRTSGNRTIEVSHSEHVRRTQRREFYRACVLLPASVRDPDGSQEAVHTTLTELGGGGASIQNPDQRFANGDCVNLCFRDGKKKTIEINGEVVRLSHRGKIAHIEFYALSECDRDRIIGLLFGGSVV